LKPLLVCRRKAMYFPSGDHSGVCPSPSAVFSLVDIFKIKRRSYSSLYTNCLPLGESEPFPKTSGMSALPLKLAKNKDGSGANAPRETSATCPISDGIASGLAAACFHLSSVTHVSNAYIGV